MSFSGEGRDFMPDVDVRETRNSLEVSAELPGVEQKDLDVRLDANVLTIRGEKRAEKTENDGTCICSECSYGAFVRSIPIEAKIDTDHIAATFKNGVLTVTLPKAKPGKDLTSRIEVKPG